MILTDYLTCKKSLQWDYAKQAGISHAVIRLPEDDNFDVTKKEHWEQLYWKFVNYGFKPEVIEPMPNSVHDHIKIGDSFRDESIEKVIKMFPIMDQLDIRIICMNFMAHIGWYRTTSIIKERGGALVTGFDIDKAQIDPTLTIRKEQLWYNLEYFLKAVVPYAEKYGIKLGIHPDDPPVQKLGNVSRILTSLENVQKAIDLYPSKSVGVSLCQGTFATMGEDVIKVIKQFCRQDKVFFVHFRDIRGTKTKFHETFHDNGQTNMVKVVKAYRDCNFNGPIRVDHVPTMSGEDNSNPGYASIGRLFAIGYLKGLLEGSDYSYK
ncbi:MAG: TIM barrel protein [Clostridiaceae bacterium]|nr:TIM barrel protein [Clostridiaceae bacterium]